MFVGTALASLLLNPVFAWVVSRFQRRVFLALVYLFFAGSLLGFYGLIVLAPAAIGVISGQVFYVWFSVFNLFSAMLFWAVMSDCFSLEQSKRLFALIAVGGTLGAMVGPALASLLAAPLGTPALLLLSYFFLVLGLAAASVLIRVQPVREMFEQPGSLAQQAPIGGSAWAGMQAVFRSRYLLSIAAYVLILANMATFLYFTRLQMVAALDVGLDTRTALFARIDVITQASTLLIQVLVSGHLMKRFGVGLTLALLPVLSLFGFIGLALVSSLLVLIGAESAFKAVQRAVMRPARETLFTVLNIEEKYKAKALIDTFVYRFGDVAGAQLEGLLGRLGAGLIAVASVAMPLALVWILLAFYLGRMQQEKVRTNGDGKSEH